MHEKDTCGMPQIEGIELIRNIKSKFPFCNIIAVSGSKPYYLYLAKKLGIQGVFTKPIDNDRFISSVQNILNIRSMKDAINI